MKKNNFYTNIKKNLNYIYFILFFFSIYFLIYNFNIDRGYWYDEMYTLFISNPNVSMPLFFERYRGNFETYFIYDSVPHYYYLILRQFFLIFDYSVENGRIFSIISFIISIFVIYFISRLFLDKSNSLMASGIISLNPFLLWMANETRIAMFLVLISVINIFFFLKLITTKKNYLNYLVLISNFLLLSIYPLTISLIAGQIAFIIYQYLFLKEKNIKIFIIILISISLWIIINNEYLLFKITSSQGNFARFYYKFFVSYFFNIFFGSIYFGAFYIFLTIYFLFKNLRKILTDKLLVFLSISILTTYLMIIVSSIFATPIMAPRYIIFVIPLILIWIVRNIEFLNINHKNLFKFFICMISILNIIVNYDNKPIKKPPTDEALNLILENNEKNIFISTSSIHYRYYINYFENLKSLKKKDFNIINENQINENKISSFAFLCLNNPRYAIDHKYGRPKDDKNCMQNFKSFQNYKSIDIPDYKIRFFIQN